MDPPLLDLPTIFSGELKVQNAAKSQSSLVPMHRWYLHACLPYVSWNGSHVHADVAGLGRSVRPSCFYINPTYPVTTWDLVLLLIVKSCIAFNCGWYTCLGRYLVGKRKRTSNSNHDGSPSTSLRRIGWRTSMSIDWYIHSTTYIYLGMYVHPHVHIAPKHIRI